VAVVVVVLVVVVASVVVVGGLGGGPLEEDGSPTPLRGLRLGLGFGKGLTKVSDLLHCVQKHIIPFGQGVNP